MKWFGSQQANWATNYLGCRRQYPQHLVSDSAAVIKCHFWFLSRTGVSVVRFWFGVEYLHFSFCTSLSKCSPGTPASWKLLTHHKIPESHLKSLCPDLPLWSHKAAMGKEGIIWCKVLGRFFHPAFYLLQIKSCLCWWGGRLYSACYWNSTVCTHFLFLALFLYCRHPTWQGPLEGQMYHKACIPPHLGVTHQFPQVALGSPHQASSRMEGMLPQEGIRHRECRLTRDTRAALGLASPHHHLVSSLWAIQDCQELTQASSPCQITLQVQVWTHLCPLTQDLQGLQLLLEW